LQAYFFTNNGVALHTNTEKNIFAFSQLGFLMQGFLQRLGLTQGIKSDFFAAIAQSVEGNLWFTEHSVRQSLCAVAHDMLSPQRMQEWLSRYAISEGGLQKNIGIIMAGNIPLVGFHDLLCVLMAGHRAVVKMSSKDSALLPLLVKYLVQIDRRFAGRVELVEQLKNVEAVMATGSDNSARYFELEFGQLPHIFRKNRTSVAVLSGSESEDELQGLAHDALDYFGLGCRSVGKIFVPKGFDATRLQHTFSTFASIRRHAPYSDCVRYATALHQMRRDTFWDFGSCIAAYSAALHSPVGEVFLQEYASPEALRDTLIFHKSSLQCIATSMPLAGLESRCVSLGKAQRPRLWDYADGVDTMNFLLALS